MKFLFCSRFILGFLAAGLLGLWLWVPVRGGLDKDSAGVGLSVMTYNIWDLGGKRPDLKDVAGVIDRAGVPDVLLLQEVRGEQMAVSLALALGFMYHLYRNDAARGHDYGVAILSRYPLRDGRSLNFKSSGAGRGVLGATVVVGGREVRVCTVHLDRIDPIEEDREGACVSWGKALSLLAHETMDETVRSRCVKELVAWAGWERVIIGGDFNTVFCSRAVREMETAFEDALAGTSDYVTGTYIKSGLPVAPRLDYVFYSRDLRCLKARVVRESAGDHYPVWARLGFK